MDAEAWLVGDIAQGDAPEWEPLLRVVGENLTSTFMWIYEVRTRSGARLYAYKHIDTRRYLHLDAEGNAYVYVPEDRYRPIPLADALESALRPWWERLGASPDEVLAAWTAIAAARRIADGRNRSLPGTE